MLENKIIVLQGPPASGKSTWARKYQEEHRTDTVIVSRDNERDARGVYWEQSQEDYITACEEFKLREGLKRGYNVIMDSTNLNPRTIDKWNRVAKEMNVGIEFKEFYIPFAEALKRDANPDRTHQVGKKVIKSFYQRYYPVRYQEETREIDTRKRIAYDSSKHDCICVDLDGTLAIHNGRSPFEYSKVGTDICDERLQRIIRLIKNGGNVKVVFLSGREGTVECMQNTLDWLNENFEELPVKYMELDDDTCYSLIMRKQGDFRADDIVKKELYETYLKDKFNVLCVFDDRDKVVKMWREEGILCNQVYYGDF